jgi:hypothetical protein
MDAIRLINTQNWCKLSEYSDYTNPILSADDDNEWSKALSKYRYNWETMCSTDWGNLAALIYHGELHPRRESQRSTLIMTIEQSMKTETLLIIDNYSGFVVTY